MQNINLQLFGKVIDLTEELSSEKPKIKLGEKEYEINTSFKTILELDKVFKAKSSDMTFIQKFLNISLGAKAAQELLDLNLSVKSYKKIISVIGDEIKGDSDDENSGNSN